MITGCVIGALAVLSCGLARACRVMYVGWSETQKVLMEVQMEKFKWEIESLAWRKQYHLASEQLRLQRKAVNSN